MNFISWKLCYNKELFDQTQMSLYFLQCFSPAGYKWTINLFSFIFEKSIVEKIATV